MALTIGGVKTPQAPGIHWLQLMRCSWRPGGPSSPVRNSQTPLFTAVLFWWASCRCRTGRAGSSQSWQEKLST